MTKKKSVKKKEVSKKKPSKKKVEKKKPKIDLRKTPTLKLRNERDIAFDFATKTYKRFNKIIKSIILFGSTVKESAVTGSDIDIIIVIDDISIAWDQELIAWYREELGKIIQENPYNKELHINTVKLSTWWDDLTKGDPTILNILRHGEELIDFAGFFTPLKYLLIKGKIRSTPEAVYNALQRAPIHIQRSKVAELSAIEGLYWAMVDSAQAALIAAQITPPSPEHIPINLKEAFVDTGKLKMKYVTDYRNLHFIHKQIQHGEIKELKGVEIDDWRDKTEEFLKAMVQLVKEIIEK